MDKIGICTLYTGYNYGSALQATATKAVLKQLGYEPEIWKLSGSLVYGRDIRIKKILCMGLRLAFHLKRVPAVLSSYNTKKQSHLTDESKKLFAEYDAVYIQPYYIAEKELKKTARDKQYLAFVCGSDQIWNSTTYYADPFYYLTFAPEEKRIAFAPSFGRDFIPDYNKRILRKYIERIPALSVREETGKQLIWELTGREAAVLLDPTLLLSKELWINYLGLAPTGGEKYVLAYFLDSPSEKAVQMLRNFRESGYRIVALSCGTDTELADCCPDSGPKQFLEYLLNAEIVCTDSFHGTAFSVNFEKEFYVFRREYGVNADQSTRVTSLLQKVGMMERYEETLPSGRLLDYSGCRTVLENERRRSVEFLRTSLENVRRCTEHA